MAYEHLTIRDVDLSKLGFGNSISFEFDKEKCYLRVSIFENDHYQDHFVVDLRDEFCVETPEEKVAEAEDDGF